MIGALIIAIAIGMIGLGMIGIAIEAVRITKNEKQLSQENSKLDKAR